MTSESRALVLSAVLILSLLAPSSIRAAGTPAVPVPSDRWGTLQPAGVLGDSTRFEGHTEPVRGNVREYHDVDVENGFLFVATGQGMAIFNLQANPLPIGPVSYIFGYFDEWSVKTSVGVLTIEPGMSGGGGGAFPSAIGETYRSALLGKRYGHALPVLSEADAAAAQMVRSNGIRRISPGRLSRGRGIERDDRGIECLRLQGTTDILCVFPGCGVSAPHRLFSSC